MDGSKPKTKKREAEKGNNNVTKRKKCPKGFYRKRGTEECITRQPGQRAEGLQQLTTEGPASFGQRAEGLQQLTSQVASPPEKFAKIVVTATKKPIKTNKTVTIQIPVPAVSEMENSDSQENSDKEEEELEEEQEEEEEEEKEEELEEEEQEEAIDQDEYPFLYPSLSDPSFNIKIAQRKEFRELAYDATIYSIKQRAIQLCSADFEIMPHQLFVKNFLSLQTPYNGLLLFMGLGSGKTCSAIGIAEEMRTYLQQTGIDQKPFVPRIIVMAAPNVQDNFRHQLFDPSKLREENGVWNIRSCMGNKLIQEINPSHVKGMTRESLINSIHRIINKYYEFMGYYEFANYAKRCIYGEHDEYRGNENQEIRNIKKFFSNRLVIIDEVHNIRTEDSLDKTVANKLTYKLLLYIAEHAENLRLVLLSATPIYNSPPEIIGLTNLLNVNDRRSKLRERDVFDSKGNLLPHGKELLVRKLTGYISYVRGENPYTFPYRIYPSTFSSQHNKVFSVPTTSYQNKPILPEDGLQYIDVYKTQMRQDSYQQRTYLKMCSYLHSTTEDDRKFGYTRLLGPLQALNIVYPTTDHDDIPTTEDKDIVYKLVGAQGLKQTMNSIDRSRDANPERYNFEYKPEILSKHGRIFSSQQISKYSHKIASICDAIRHSTGIVMIYSQFIDGGLIPMALALEEMGFTRYGDTKNLFAKGVVGVPPSGNQYVIITGDACFSMKIRKFATLKSFLAIV